VADLIDHSKWPDSASLRIEALVVIDKLKAENEHLRLALESIEQCGACRTCKLIARAALGDNK
jgi:hypothetical protein